MRIDLNSLQLLLPAASDRSARIVMCRRRGSVEVARGQWRQLLIDSGVL